MSRFNREAMFSSAKGTWETPDDLYHVLDTEFHFTLDTSSQENGFDAFKNPWTGRVYCNPPYGRDVYWWIREGYLSIYGNFHTAETVVFLLPARTDTRWFHEFILGKAEIRFIKGRLRFKGAHASAPFPSMIVIFRLPQKDRETEQEGGG